MWLVFLIFGVVLILLGAGFVASSHFVGKRQAELEQRCTATAEARLVDTACRTIEFSDDTSVSYHGVYSFVTDDDVRVQAENKSGYGLPDDVPGPLVTIRFNPNNPGEFIIPNEQSQIAESKVLPGLRRSGIAMLAGGVPLVAIAIVLWAMQG